MTLAVAMTATTPITLRVNETQFIDISGVERFADGSGYASRLSVSSGRFACSEHPFYFDSLLRFTKDITRAYERVEGTARLAHTYESDFIEIRVFSGGHVSVAGVVVQHGPPHQELSFAFGCDQTFLPELLRSLSRVARELEETT